MKNVRKRRLYPACQNDVLEFPHYGGSGRAYDFAAIAGFILNRRKSFIRASGIYGA